jgi:hypothetical protein
LVEKDVPFMNKTLKMEKEGSKPLSAEDHEAAGLMNHIKFYSKGHHIFVCDGEVAFVLFVLSVLLLYHTVPSS